jgi:hypothetical protein
MVAGRREGRPPRQCDDDEIDPITAGDGPESDCATTFLFFGCGHSFYLFPLMYNFSANERPVLVKDHSMQHVYYSQCLSCYHHFSQQRVYT